MTRWRVTYRPVRTEGVSARRIHVTIDDPASSSIDSFAARLTGGALGAEWTQGRDVQSIQAVVPFIEQNPKALGLTVLVGIGVVILVVVGFVIPVGHPWSVSISKLNGAYESFPNGSQVSGQWAATEPVWVQIVIVSTGTLVCTSNDVSCAPTGVSGSWVTTGTFQFTSVGGQVQFSALSNDPVNISVIGTWSAQIL
jgi:hypothetical protein